MSETKQEPPRPRVPSPERNRSRSTSTAYAAASQHSPSSSSVRPRSPYRGRPLPSPSATARSPSLKPGAPPLPRSTVRTAPSAPVYALFRPRVGRLLPSARAEGDAEIARLQEELVKLDKEDQRAQQAKRAALFTWKMLQRESDREELKVQLAERNLDSIVNGAALG